MLRPSRVRETERRYAEHVAAFEAAAADARNGCGRAASTSLSRLDALGRGVFVPRDLVERVIDALDNGTAHRQLAIELSALTESEDA